MTINNYPIQSRHYKIDEEDLEAIKAGKYI